MLVCLCLLLCWYVTAGNPVSLPTWQVPSDSSGYVIFEGWTHDFFVSLKLICSAPKSELWKGLQHVQQAARHCVWQTSSKAGFVVFFVGRFMVLIHLYCPLTWQKRFSCFFLVFSDQLDLFLLCFCYSFIIIWSTWFQNQNRLILLQWDCRNVL